MKRKRSDIYRPAPQSRGEDALGSLLPGKIGTRLFLLIALAFIPLLLLFGWISWERYETLRSQALATELEVAHGVATTFRAYIEDLRRQNHTIGQAILSLEPNSPEQIVRLLRNAVTQYPTIRNMNWVAPDGTILASSDPKAVGNSLAARPYFRRIVAGSRWAVGDLTRTGVFTNRPTFAVGTAIRDEDGILRGAVVVGMEPTRLGMLPLTLRRPHGGSYAVFDAEGTLVFRVPVDAIEWEERVRWSTEDEILRRVNRTDIAHVGIQRLPLMNDQWITARVPVPAVGWVVGAGRPVAFAFAPIRRSLVTDSAFAALAFAAAFFLAYLIARTISEPLRRLEAEARALGEGSELIGANRFAPIEAQRLRRTIRKMADDLYQRAETLREQSAYLGHLIDSLPGLLWTMDADGKIDYVSPQWLAFTGTTFDTQLDEGGFQAIHPEDRDKAYEAWETAIERCTEYDMEYRLRRHDGVYCWFSSRGTPIRDADGRCVRWIGISTDIEALKRAEHELTAAKEQAEAANDAKSEFLAHMSHELRTPISGIVGMIDVLSARVRDTEQLLHLSLARESAETLLSIVGDVLDLSRIESGIVEVEPVRCNLHRSIEAVLMPFALDARTGGEVAFSYRIGQDVPEYASADIEKIAQTLRNLVSNAFKYTERGRVEVTVEREADAAGIGDGSVPVRFSVEDTGIGIPENKREAIFESFVRLRRSVTERNVEGTGLGLSISKRLVELLGGTLLLESDFGKGSTFSFTVPVEPAAAQPSEPPMSPAADLAAVPPLSILVVEDNRISRMFLEVMLREAGHRVTCVENGKEALQALDGASDSRASSDPVFDIVLMDIQMPIMDGLEATRRIRGLDPPVSRMPIVALTAFSMKGDEERFRAAGMDAYVTKPVNWNELAAAILSAKKEPR